MANKVIEVKNLIKHYGDPTAGFRAVDNISFSVEEGEVVGFLGPNGAGKTTTIQMLLGITNLTSGSIKYFGKDFTTHREESLQRINFASAFNTLQGRITVMENLMVFARLYSVNNPKKKILELANLFKSEDLLKKEYFSMSAGQKTRVNIIKSLLNDPDVLLLDEPTASLDPDVADTTLSLIQELKKSRNISLLFTSHNMDEITRICDRVIFLDGGRIVAEDTPLNLTKKISNAKLIISFDAKKEIVEKYLDGENQKYSFANNFTVVIETEEKLIPSLIFGLSKADIWITDIEIKKPTLEDFFLHIARGKFEKGDKNVN
jgi:ABC-2 type transport system ATP-binding protein